MHECNLLLSLCRRKYEKTEIMKTLHSLLLSLGFVGSLMYAQGGIRALVQEGDRLRKERRYEEALQKYEEAIKLDMTKAPLHMRKGEVLAALKRYDQALEAYKKAAELNPSLPGVYARMASIHIQQKNYAAAVEAYNQGYQRDTDTDRRIRYKLNAIRLLGTQGRSQEAFTELANLKRDIPNSAKSLDVLFAEGQLHLNLNNPQSAIAAFQSGYDITQTSPVESARFLFGLALAHYKAGNMAEYEKYAKLIQDPRYRQRLQRTIAQSGAVRNLSIASAYFRVGALDEAMEYVNEALKTKDRLNMVYMLQGTILFRKGRVAEAARSFLEAAANESDEKRRTALYNRAIRLQYNAGDYSGVINTADSILRRTPRESNTGINVLLLKAQSYYLMGRYDEAISTLEQLLPALANDEMRRSQAYFLIGLSARKKGQTDKAREAFDKVTFRAFRAAAKIESDKLTAR
ncbi:MAG: tetratricopeptide repeat protein [Bacteroidia bacterium]|nr:tetratricopeptide repeat protein [Bacteroidia bacterium]